MSLKTIEILDCYFQLKIPAAKPVDELRSSRCRESSKCKEVIPFYCSSLANPVRLRRTTGHALAGAFLPPQHSKHQTGGPPRGWGLQRRNLGVLGFSVQVSVFLFFFPDTCLPRHSSTERRRDTRHLTPLYYHFFPCHFFRLLVA
jgi:hypothetical protein